MRLQALGFLLVLAGAVAACSGNIGGGANAVPGGPGQPGALASALALPTGTPSSASGVVNVASSAGPQTLPNVGGYTASIAFPQTTASPTTMSVVSSLVLPQGIPAPFESPTGGKKHGLLGLGKGHKGAPPPYRALLYISFVPTTTLTFDQLPQFVFGIPQPVVASFGDGWDVGLGLYDPGDKTTKKFKLAIADRVAVASAAPNATASPSPTPSLTPTPTPSATPSPNPSASRTASPSPTPVPTPTITLIAVGFGTPETALTFQANKTYVFVLYAIVNSTPTAEPSGSASPSPSASPTATSAPSPSASPSASPAPART